ncbi:MAG: hypothetical protein NZZ60_01395 [Bacteroidia bacterium]|nr:hypothetical protein [Bacteroidia bacterium]
MRRFSYFLPALVSACIGALVIVVAYGHWEEGKLVRFALIDDAMISMSFARSLAEGCGLVWYCGAEKVEGYTNLGWVLYMAFWHLLGIPPAYTSLPIFLTGLFTLVWHIRGIYQVGCLFDEKIAHIAAWMAAVFPPLIFHHTSGLEAGFLAMLLTYYLYESRPSGSIAWMTGIAMIGTVVRLDFILGVITLSAARALSLWIGKVPNEAKNQRLKLLWLPVGLALLIALVITLWRKNYYDAWVPNTYELKVASVPLGWRILNGGIAAFMHVGMNLPAWALAAVGLWVWRASLQAWISAALLGVSVAYSIYVGGDIYESATQSNRFLLNGFVTLLVWAAAGTATLSSRPVSWAFLVLLVSYGLPIPLLSQIAYRWKGLFRSQQEFYIPVERYFPPGTPLLVGAAGTTPYFFRGYRWIDLLGKIDTATARRGLVVLCNGRPPLLYFPGHTRLDTFHLWNVEGVVRGIFISCTDSAASPLRHWWWSNLVHSLSPCRGRVPPWLPFPTAAFRDRFCAVYEPIREFPGSWKRRSTRITTPLSNPSQALPPQQQTNLRHKMSSSP